MDKYVVTIQYRGGSVDRIEFDDKDESIAYLNKLADAGVGAKIRSAVLTHEITTLEQLAGMVWGE